MATIHTNAGLTMAMESAIASAKTITAISLFDPGVVTSAAHGYSDGDIVLLEVLGMTQVNGRLFEVLSSTTDTFQLMDTDGATGIDTTNFTAFTSGTAKKVTLGTTITGVQNLSGSGGDPVFLDTTTVMDRNRTQVISGANPISYNLTMQWDPADAAQAAMIAAYNTSASKGFKITWPNGRYAMFYGSVGYAGMPGGTSQGVTTSEAAVALDGAMTYGL